MARQTRPEPHGDVVRRVAEDGGTVLTFRSGGDELLAPQKLVRLLDG